MAAPKAVEKVDYWDECWAGCLVGHWAVQTVAHLASHWVVHSADWLAVSLVAAKAC